MSPQSLNQRIQALKLRRRSVRPSEIHSLLLEVGFSRRMGKGDHWVYTHPELPYPLTIDPRNPILPAYVSSAIRLIESVLDEEPES